MYTIIFCLIFSISSPTLLDADVAQAQTQYSTADVLAQSSSAGIALNTAGMTSLRYVNVNR
jgi:hypothetical protein